MVVLAQSGNAYGAQQRQQLGAVTGLLWGRAIRDPNPGTAD